MSQRLRAASWLAAGLTALIMLVMGQSTSASAASAAPTPWSAAYGEATASGTFTRSVRTVTDILTITTVQIEGELVNRSSTCHTFQWYLGGLNPTWQDGPTLCAPDQAPLSASGSATGFGTAPLQFRICRTNGPCGPATQY